MSDYEVLQGKYERALEMIKGLKEEVDMYKDEFERFRRLEADIRVLEGKYERALITLREQMQEIDDLKKANADAAFT